MKKLLVTALLFVLTISLSLSQAPQSFKYQAIARDLNGDVIPDQDIGLRITILSGSVDGTPVYSETHDLTTNQFGLFTLNIGEGKNNIGNFSDIGWGTSTHFVKIEIDKSGGQNYSLLGVSQLLSVPYALYAETSGFSDSSKQANSWTETLDEVFLTDPNKKVGIGNTLPDEKLHVSGNIELDNGFAIIQNDTNLIRRYWDSYYIGSQNSGGLPLKNTFVGFNSGEGAAYAQENVLFGYQAGRYIGSGDYNTILGVQAGYNSFNGRYNTYLGYHSGFNATGSYNIFLGYNAGREEGSSNRLYIENSNSSSPLIYGEFDNDLVRINGTLDINNQYQLPTADGNTGQILKTDGSGNLSWYDDTGADVINDLGDARTGGESVFLGSGAGSSDDLTNNQNVALGVNSLAANISGDNNTAQGHNSMYTNTIGSKNTANGTGALYSNTSGNMNTSVGYHSLYSNTGGSNNTALGETALFYNTTGINNTAVGSGSSSFNSTGNGNVAIGRHANFFNQTGINNTIVGYQAGMGMLNTSFSGNIFIGYQAGYNETTSNKLYIENSNSSSPLIYGDFDNDLLRVNGTLNINNQYQLPVSDGANGQTIKTDGSGLLTWVDDHGASRINDLLDGKTVGGSVFLGFDSGKNDDGSENRNVAVGDSTLISNIDGFHNSALGYKALHDNLDGAWNTAIGYKSMYKNTEGYDNTAVGWGALYENIDGYENIAVGSFALYENIYGAWNTAIGYDVLGYNETGVDNTATGWSALNSNIDGRENTADGSMSLYSNTSGIENSSFGAFSSIGNTSGSNNTVIGAYANYYNEEGSGNTIIGNSAGSGTTPHNKSGSVFIGFRAGQNEMSDNKLYIENSNSSSPLIYGEFDNDILAVNGKLGVGTTAPDEELDVNGNIKASGTLQSGSSVIIDGDNGKITSTNGTMSFDDDHITTTGNIDGNEILLNSGNFRIAEDANNIPWLNVLKGSSPNKVFEMGLGTNGSGNPAGYGLNINDDAGTYMAGMGMMGGTWYNGVLSHGIASAAGAGFFTTGDGSAYGIQVGPITTPTFSVAKNGVVRSMNNKVQNLSSGATIVMDINSGHCAKLTLTSNTNLILSNLYAGAKGFIITTQDATGGWTLIISPTPITANGGGYSLTSTAGSVDMIPYFYDGTNLFVNVNKDFQ